MPERRTYLDWNATAPLRPEACAEMIAAMDICGNPSSIHAEGRAAKGLIERARVRIARLVDCDPDRIVFTGGATEAAALAAPTAEAPCAAIEHECVAAWHPASLQVAPDGRVLMPDGDGPVTLQAANSETGVMQVLGPRVTFCDAVQAVGKVRFSMRESGVEMAAISAHKFGGPKGVGALILRDGLDVIPQILGGGQEQGRRSGTENVIGIAGFGAAAEAAQRDLEQGAWDRVAALRDDLEDAVRDCAPDAQVMGAGAPRLPNTSCLAIPGWSGATQVMQLDLAGFAISAGSACSSGKPGASRTLAAMGLDAGIAGSAIRISLGPTTRKDEVLRFIDAWTALYRRKMTRAA